jgi:hypothetical protein
LKKAVLKDFRAAMNRESYPPDDPRCWGSVLMAKRLVVTLATIMRDSNAEKGWSGNPIAVIERLIKSVEEIDELELSGIPEELAKLSGEMEELIPVP